MTPQLKGILITLAGVLIIVPDSLMIRLIEAPAFTIIFWRSLFSCAAMVLIASFTKGWRWLSPPALLFAVTEASGTFLFIVALDNTSVASTLFLVSTAPLMSAVLSWLVLGERLKRRMVWTIAISLIGIAIIASGEEGGAPSRLLGDMAALGVALSLAVAFTTVRHSPDLPVVPALALAYILASLAATIFATTLAVHSTDWIWIILNGGIFVPIGFLLLSIGPRYITSTEVSLILLLEAVLAPLLVWAVLAENPGERVILGGAILIGVLMISNLISLRRRKR